MTFGYQKMGLTDETSELRDLGDARLAIELLRADLGVVERELGGALATCAHAGADAARVRLAQMQLGGRAQARAAAGRGRRRRPPQA